MALSGHAPDCRCCAGVDEATPRGIANAPGLPAIRYRAGRHSEFLQSMRARLSSGEYPALAALSTRETSDASLALSDALASSLEVLSFYAERFANEHYLRTAGERRSVIELARLVGYRPSPGVAAATHLAFTLQDAPGAPAEPITIPVGTRVQSVPGQDELPQTFETVAAAPARVEWNAMPVRRGIAWTPHSGDTELWLAGINTQLAAGDAIVIVGEDRLGDADSDHWDVRVLAGADTDTENNRTRVYWSRPLGSAFPPSAVASTHVEVHAFRLRAALFGHNAPDPNLLGNDDSNVAAKINQSGSHWTWKNYAINGTVIDLDSAYPKITAGSWLALVSNKDGLGYAELPGYVELYRAKRVAQLSRGDFGLSGKITRITPDGTENFDSDHFSIPETLVLAGSERLSAVDRPLFEPVYGDQLSLGIKSAELKPGQAMALSGPRQRIAIVDTESTLSLKLDDGRTRELLTGDELFLMRAPRRVQLVIGAWSPPSSGGLSSGFGGLLALFQWLAHLRISRTVLTPEQFLAAIGDDSVSLELDLLDRDGMRGTLSVKASEIRLAPSRKDDAIAEEIAFIADAAESVVLGRDDTQVALAAPLSQVYEREHLRVNANVAPATHGETVNETLGSGDGRLANQGFALAQTPLTYVSAPTPSGSASTLELRVNDALWREERTLYAADAEARVFVTRENDDAVTSLRFGDGVEGARLPSGSGNVRARYRKGLGAAGNVGAGKLTTLLSRPLGVSAARNPQAATGGADAEALDRARDNAPLTVLTLDRAVSIADYANFVRAFAGIDKAHALWIPSGVARGVFVTIAGVDGAVVPASGDTYQNLQSALTRYGDARMPLRLVNYRDARFRCALAIKVRSAFEIDPVLVAVRAALRDAFGFSERRFGQPVSVDEVTAVAQAVRGVEAVRVNALYREGEATDRVPRLFAQLPVASPFSVPEAAELLRLSDAAVDVEVLP